MFDLNCLTFIPFVSYNDALSNKKKAIKENEKKSGIYCWTHLANNKSYIGSSINLGRRLRSYYNPIFITHISRKNMIINKALIKHGYSEFKLEIIEYCDPKELVKREQYYLDLLSPKYNVLKFAYSSVGYKHTQETMVKVNKNLVNFNISKSINVKVTNLETNVLQEYASIFFQKMEAAKYLNTNRTTLTKYILNSKPFKGIYKLESNLTVSNYDSNYINHPNSVQIEVHDLELKTITCYTSIHATSRALGIKHNTISNFFNRNQKSPYKGRYMFKKVV